MPPFLAFLNFIMYRLVSLCEFKVPNELAVSLKKNYPTLQIFLYKDQRDPANNYR